MSFSRLHYWIIMRELEGIRSDCTDILVCLKVILRDVHSERDTFGLTMDKRDVQRCNILI